MKYTDFFLDFINDVKKNKFTNVDALKEPIINQMTIDEHSQVHAALCYLGHNEDEQSNAWYSNTLILIYPGKLDKNMDIEYYREMSIWFDLDDIETISQFVDMFRVYNKPLINSIEVKTSHEYGDGFVCFMGNHASDIVELGFEARSIRGKKYEFNSFQLNKDKFMEFIDDANILTGTLSVF